MFIPVRCTVEASVGTKLWRCLDSSIPETPISPLALTGFGAVRCFLYERNPLRCQDSFGPELPSLALALMDMVSPPAGSSPACQF